MIKRSLSFLLFCLVLSAAFCSKAVAQTNVLPPFKMLLSNGRFFSARELQPGKPVVLIYFAPGCDHCEQLMGTFFGKIHSFKHAEVLMVTFKPVSEVLRFEQAHHTFTYPNIKVGTEGNTFFLRTYYHLDRTPFMALYNKKQTLISSYRNEMRVDDLITRLNALIE